MHQNQNLDPIPQEVVRLAEMIDWMCESVPISQEAWGERLKASRPTIARIRSFSLRILQDKVLVPLPSSLALMSVAMASRRNYPEPITPGFADWLAKLEEAYNAAWEVYPSVHGEITEKRRAIQRMQQGQGPDTEPHHFPPGSLLISKYQHCGD